MKKEQLTKGDLESWKRKRKITFVVYVLQYFVSGMEVSINMGTLWIYVSTLINTERRGLFYGLINAAIFLPTILFSAPIARWADHTRRIKFCMIIINFLSMVGSILYIIPWSSIYALCGSFFQGFSITTRPLIVGEIACSFDEVEQKLPLLTAFLYGGHVASSSVCYIIQRDQFLDGKFTYNIR